MCFNSFMYVIDWRKQIRFVTWTTLHSNMCLYVRTANHFVDRLCIFELLLVCFIPCYFYKLICIFMSNYYFIYRERAMLRHEWASSTGVIPRSPKNSVKQRMRCVSASEWGYQRQTPLKGRQRTCDSLLVSMGGGNRLLSIDPSARMPPLYANRTTKFMWLRENELKSSLLLSQCETRAPYSMRKVRP